MMTPETAGGSFNGEVELSRVSQADGKVNLNKPRPYPLKFDTIESTNYYAALAMLESVDVTWWHVASGPSILGLKWQFIGNSLRQAGAGHSMALAAGIGGNSHEVEASPKVEFDVSVTDFALLHGYWLTPEWQIFDSIGLTRFSAEGRISGPGRGRFEDEGSLLMLAIGTAYRVGPVRLKVEYAHTRADWSGSKVKTNGSFGFGLGFIF